MLPRLSTYPHVIVRVACSRCPRLGSFRLARLAERYGAEITIGELLAHLSADCPKRTLKRYKGDYEVCGACLPDLAGRPDPEPPTTSPPAPALRVVGGGR